MEALQSRLGAPAQIDQAKFLAPVLPGDTLTLSVTTQGNSLAVRTDARQHTGRTRSTLAAACSDVKPLTTMAESPAPKAAWAEREERGSVWLLRFMAWLASTLGRRIARLVLHPITAYFVLFSPAARRNSIRYLRRALGREPSWADGYRHVHTFASIVLDRLYFARGDAAQFDLQHSGGALLDEALAQGRGAVMLGAHLGSFEALQAVGEQHANRRIAMVMYPANAQNIQRVLNAVAPANTLKIITIGHPGTTLAIRDWLDGGGLVGMLGDRVLQERRQGHRRRAAPALPRPPTRRSAWARCGWRCC